ncbi:hypothetical protein I4U23_025455 [Adineta vaga]|nr:hypothetical protein I4U23_025455 [Adineta vaga]
MISYRYQTVYYFWCVLTVFLLNSNGIIAQQTQSPSLSTLNPTTIPTVLYNDGNVYYGDNDDRDQDIYDDQEEANDDSLPANAVDPKLYNTTSQGNHEGQIKGVEEENSYPDDDDEFVDQIYGNTMSVHRIDAKRPTVDIKNEKPTRTQPSPRLPFISTDLWNELFTKPAIVVGIVGGVVIGMLSAILLIMFIIYRMRKKDEGSYALEEGPRKSPSHAYTRVSSREFFA